MIPVILIIIFVAVLSFGLIRLTYNKYWDKGLDVNLNFAEDEVREGDSTALLEVITNRKNLPLPAVEIDFSLDRGLRFVNTENSMVSDKLYRRDIFALSSNQKITRRLELRCIKRGYYTLKENGLSANDIFLSKKYVASFPQSTELYVCPARISTERIAVPFNRIMGELLSKNRVFEDPFEFGGIRDYTITDPMKNINWKASAKTGSLAVNFHDSTLSQKLCILLDTSGSNSAMEAELDEESIRITAALAERVAAEGISLDILGCGRDLENGEQLKLTGLSTGSMDLVNKSLARLRLNHDDDMKSLMESLPADNRTVYIFVGKNKQPYIQKELVRLAGDTRSLWICPYENEAPEIAVDKGKVELILWAADKRKAGKEL